MVLTEPPLFYYKDFTRRNQVNLSLNGLGGLGVPKVEHEAWRR